MIKAVGFSHLEIVGTTMLRGGGVLHAHHGVERNYTRPSGRDAEGYVSSIPVLYPFMALH